MKSLFLGAMVLISTSLFTSCDNENQDILNDENNTFVSISFSLPLNSGAKAPAKAPAALPDDYNKIGEWAGKDKIDEVTIYLVDGTTVNSNSFTVATDESGDYKQELSGSSVVLKPKKGIKTSVGVKKVYVLVNGTTEVKAVLATANASDFESAYKTAALSLANSGTSATVNTSADKLASKNGVTDEKIVMTNVQEVTINIAPNVTEAQSLDAVSPKNRASVSVQRAVARVMITTAASTYTLMSGATALGVISDISWALAQGENSLYVQQKASFESPNYGYVPADQTDYETNAGLKFDYSGLFENTLIPTMADYTTPLANVTAELNSQLAGKFILPTTHLEANDETSSYRKGNTAYVLVRAKFAPATSAYADGGSYTLGDDFYLGANGKFYTSAANAIDPAKGGVIGQTITRYVGGKILYYAWVNPNSVPNWFSSPVLRNNIYHIHITGFKSIGTNWNPLFPEDPDAISPENPDPKPDLPAGNETENPIDPTDPLTNPETWMSVDVTVLPWLVHSYSVELGL